MLSSAEIERELRYEIKAKRQAASGAFHKRGKGVKHGFSGAIRTPYTMLKGKAKKEYTAPGEVSEYNMYKQLCELKELQTHPEDRQKEILISWRKWHKAKDIQDALGVDHNTYYDLLYKFEILERPASWKPKKDNNPGQRHGKPEAKPEDIMSFVDLKLLPKEKQLEILDSYNDKYNLHSVAAIWGKDVKNVYSLRYSLRKGLQKANSNANNNSPDVAKQKQEELKIENDPKDAEKVEEIQTKEHPLKGMKVMDLIPEEAIEEKQEEIPEAPETNEKYEKMAAEFEQMKQLVMAQTQLLSEIVESQKEQVHLAAVGGAPIAKDTDPEPKHSGMSFSFEDAKEGFILHQDLERFISVLKKNPDQFKVEVQITRID